MKTDFAAKEAWDADPGAFLNALTGETLTDWKSESVEMSQVMFRIADRVYTARYADGVERMILVEIQAQNDVSMLARLLVYIGMLLALLFSSRKKWYPPRAYVLYIGAEPFTAPVEINDPGHHVFRPVYINARNVPYRRFLALAHPAQVIFAILSEDAKDREDVAIEVIRKVVALTRDNPQERQKHLLNLLRYSRFRNMEKMIAGLLEKEWEDALPEEQILQDPLYLRGEARGEARGREEKLREVVETLYSNGLSMDFIAQNLNLTLKKVKDILSQNPNASPKTNPNFS